MNRRTSGRPDPLSCLCPSSVTYPGALERFSDFGSPPGCSRRPRSATTRTRTVPTWNGADHDGANSGRAGEYGRIEPRVRRRHIRLQTTCVGEAFPPTRCLFGPSGRTAEKSCGLAAQPTKDPRAVLPGAGETRRPDREVDMVRSVNPAAAPWLRDR